jgi:hypothetical protein
VQPDHHDFGSITSSWREHDLPKVASCHSDTPSPTLLAIGKTRYTAVDTDRFPGLSCVDTIVTALGVTRRAV